MTIAELTKLVEDEVIFIHKSKIVGHELEVEFKINQQGKINIYDIATNTLIPTEVVVDLTKLANETFSNKSK